MYGSENQCCGPVEGAKQNPMSLIKWLEECRWYPFSFTYIHNTSWGTYIVNYVRAEVTYSFTLLLKHSFCLVKYMGKYYMPEPSLASYCKYLLLVSTNYFSNIRFCNYLKEKKQDPIIEKMIYVRKQMPFYTHSQF